MRTLAVSTLVLVALWGCSSTLLEVASADGSLRVRAPAGPGWKCAPNDIVKDAYRQSGVKCVLDDGIVLNAKMYEVSTADARTAELFCMQNWKEAYAQIFTSIYVSTSEVKPFRGLPACEVTLGGTSSKGAWQLWEIHQPNGRKLLQVTVTGAQSVVKTNAAVVDAWIADLRYDLSLPGQTL